MTTNLAKEIPAGYRLCEDCRGYTIVETPCGDEHYGTCKRCKGGLRKATDAEMVVELRRSVERLQQTQRESLEAVAVLQTAYSPTPTADAPLSVLARWAAVEVLELREQVKEMCNREENEILYKARGLEDKNIKPALPESDANAQ